MMETESYQILFENEETHWWLSSRRLIVLDWVAQAFPGRHDLLVLDVGCGTGQMLRELARFGHAVGVDSSPEALDYCRRRGGLTVERADVRRLPFPDGCFDAVTAVDVLEHIEDDAAAAAEWKRVLKPGGRAFIFVPAHRWLWSLQDEVAHHHRRYTAATLRGAVEGGGLRVERESYVSAYLLPVIFLGRLYLRVARRWKKYESENDLHPAWSNGILTRIFRREIPALRRRNFPVGASLLCTVVNDGSEAAS